MMHRSLCQPCKPLTRGLDKKAGPKVGSTSCPQDGCPASGGACAVKTCTVEKLNGKLVTSYTGGGLRA